MMPSPTKVKKGDPIHLKLPDGKWLTTVAASDRMISLTGAAARRSKVEPGFYLAVVLPDDFLAVGLEKGAEVYLADED